jgi:hypothetical protein
MATEGQIVELATLEWKMDWEHPSQVLEEDYLVYLGHIGEAQGFVVVL